MSGTPLRPRKYTRYFSVRFKEETYQALEKEAREKKYHIESNPLDRSKTGVTKLIREICERHTKTSDK